MGDHTVRYDGYKLTYWKGNTAAKDEEDWDAVIVETLGAFPATMAFKRNVPEQMTTFQTLLSFLDKLYEAGYRQAKRELRDWLGAESKIGF